MNDPVKTSLNGEKNKLSFSTGKTKQGNGEGDSIDIRPGVRLGESPHRKSAINTPQSNASPAQWQGPIRILNRKSVMFGGSVRSQGMTTQPGFLDVIYSFHGEKGTKARGGGGEDTAKFDH